MHHGFGDESCDDKVVVYGLLTIEPDHTAAALTELEKFKVAAGGRSNASIHCKELFVPDARSKSDWAHLKGTEDVFGMVEDLADLVTQITSHRITAVAIRSHFPKDLPGGQMRDKDGNAGGRMMKDIPFGEKQIAVFCMQAALGQYGHLANIEDLAVWADPDRTKIDWFFSRRQATLAIGKFHMDKGQGEPPGITPQLATEKEKPLTDVADLIAFVRRRSTLRDLSPNGKRFKKIYEKLRLTTPRLEKGIDGGLKFRLSNFWERDAIGK